MGKLETVKKYGLSEKFMKTQLNEKVIALGSGEKTLKEEIIILQTYINKLKGEITIGTLSTDLDVGEKPVTVNEDEKSNLTVELEGLELLLKKTEIGETEKVVKGTKTDVANLQNNVSKGLTPEVVNTIKGLKLKNPYELGIYIKKLKEEINGLSVGDELIKKNTILKEAILILETKKAANFQIMALFPEISTLGSKDMKEEIKKIGTEKFQKLIYDNRESAQIQNFIKTSLGGDLAALIKVYGEENVRTIFEVAVIDAQFLRDYINGLHNPNVLVKTNSWGTDKKNKTRKGGIFYMNLLDRYQGAGITNETFNNFLTSIYGGVDGFEKHFDSIHKYLPSVIEGIDKIEQETDPNNIDKIFEKHGVMGVIKRGFDSTQMSSSQKNFWTQASQIAIVLTGIWGVWKGLGKTKHRFLFGIGGLIGGSFAMNALTGKGMFDFLGAVMHGGVYDIFGDTFTDKQKKLMSGLISQDSLYATELPPELRMPVTLMAPVVGGLTMESLKWKDGKIDYEATKKMLESQNMEGPLTILQTLEDNHGVANMSNTLNAGVLGMGIDSTIASQKGDMQVSEYFTGYSERQIELAKIIKKYKNQGKEITIDMDLKKKYLQGDSTILLSAIAVVKPALASNKIPNGEPKDTSPADNGTTQDTALAVPKEEVDIAGDTPKTNLEEVNEIADIKKRATAILVINTLSTTLPLSEEETVEEKKLKEEYNNAKKELETILEDGEGSIITTKTDVLAETISKYNDFILELRDNSIESIIEELFKYTITYKDGVILLVGEDGSEIEYKNTLTQEQKEILQEYLKQQEKIALLKEVLDIWHEHAYSIADGIWGKWRNDDDIIRENADKIPEEMSKLFMMIGGSPEKIEEQIENIFTIMLEAEAQESIIGSDDIEKIKDIILESSLSKDDKLKKIYNFMRYGGASGNSEGVKEKIADRLLSKDAGFADVVGILENENVLVNIEGGNISALKTLGVSEKIAEEIIEKFNDIDKKQRKNKDIIRAQIKKQTIESGVVLTQEEENQEVDSYIELARDISILSLLKHELIRNKLITMPDRGDRKTSFKGIYAYTSGLGESDNPLSDIFTIKDSNIDTAIDVGTTVTGALISMGFGALAAKGLLMVGTKLSNITKLTNVVNKVGSMKYGSNVAGFGKFGGAATLEGIGFYEGANFMNNIIHSEGNPLENALNVKEITKSIAFMGVLRGVGMIMKGNNKIVGAINKLDKTPKIMFTNTSVATVLGEALLLTETSRLVEFAFEGEGEWNWEEYLQAMAMVVAYRQAGFIAKKRTLRRDGTISIEKLKPKKIVIKKELRNIENKIKELENDLALSPGNKLVESQIKSKNDQIKKLKERKEMIEDGRIGKEEILEKPTVDRSNVYEGFTNFIWKKLPKKTTEEPLILSGTKDNGIYIRKVEKGYELVSKDGTMREFKTKKELNKHLREGKPEQFVEMVESKVIDIMETKMTEVIKGKKGLEFTLEGNKYKIIEVGGKKELHKLEGTEWKRSNTEVKKFLEDNKQGLLDNYLGGLELSLIKNGMLNKVIPKETVEKIKNGAKSESSGENMGRFNKMMGEGSRLYGNLIKTIKIMIKEGAWTSNRKETLFSILKQVSLGTPGKISLGRGAAHVGGLGALGLLSHMEGDFNNISGSNLEFLGEYILWTSLPGIMAIKELGLDPVKNYFDEPVKID